MTAVINEPPQLFIPNLTRASTRFIKCQQATIHMANCFNSDAKLDKFKVLWAEYVHKDSSGQK